MVRFQTPTNNVEESKDVSIRFRNNIMPHFSSVVAGAITDNLGTGATAQKSGAQAWLSLTQGGRGSVDLGNNVFPETASNNRRPLYQTLYPEQYANAAHWPKSQAEYGFTDPQPDPRDGDYTLAASSPLKGIADGGRDPGCDMALVLASVGNRIDDIPDFITLRDPV
jgi:hypothetical protein